MEIIKGAKEYVEQEALEKLVSALNDCIEKKGKTILGIPGGRSVQGLFEKLKTANVEWNKVHVFFVDERFVDLEDSESNFQAVPFREQAKHIHPFEFQNGVDAYNEEFNTVTDSFDIIILGAGEDGHVASLFPNHPSIQNNETGFIKVIDSPKPPAERMSASRALLSKSSVAFILFFGESKREAFEKFNDDSASIEECPAKLVKNIPTVYVLTDQ